MGLAAGRRARGSTGETQKESAPTQRSWGCKYATIICVDMRRRSKKQECVFYCWRTWASSANRPRPILARPA